MFFSADKSQRRQVHLYAALDTQGGSTFPAQLQEHPAFASRRLLQDVELFLFAGSTKQELREQIEHVLALPMPDTQEAFLTLAWHHTRWQEHEKVRGALVAQNPAELYERLRILRDHLDGEIPQFIDLQQGIFLGTDATSARIGFLFTGQGAPPYRQGGLMRQRFRFIDEIYKWADLPQDRDENETTIAQPAIIVSSIAAIQLLEKLGVSATVGFGHSLGELIALYWGGVIDEDPLLTLTNVRSNAMVSGSPTGSGLTIGASIAQIEPWLAGTEAYIAGILAPQLTVVTGEATSVARVREQAQAAKVFTMPMPMTHGFHSPTIREAVPLLEAYVRQLTFHTPRRRVISTVLQQEITPETDIVQLLSQQIISPVYLMPAALSVASELDLFVEVGPGKLISSFVAQCSSTPAYSIDAGGASFKDLLNMVGYAFVLGAPVRGEVLFSDI